MTAEERAIKGIAAYSHEQKMFLRLLRKRGYFTEHEFDKWFDRREYKRQRFKSRNITGDTFVLGWGMNGGRLWGEMLELLQIMVELGMIDARTENGIVVYYSNALEDLK